ncbi:MAG: hypothetical protein VKI83_11045 [Synechococcaceae cyanobacterium]|nr:hypothetical protein [Synechococcaceae cyanobacterium]
MANEQTNELTYVGETGTGCLIYREPSGGYVVRHERSPNGRQRVATLASAYATSTCRQLAWQSAGPLVDRHR